MIDKILDWSKADWNTPEGTKQIVDALHHFYRLQTDLTGEWSKSKIDHFTVRGDFPAEAYPWLEQLRKTVPPDIGWSKVFKILDFRSGDGAGGESGFDIACAGSGVYFEELKPGERIKLKQAQGTSMRVPFVMYGGGISWDRTLLQDGRWWDMDDNFREISNAYNLCIAQALYGMIESVGADNNTSWQSPTPGGLSSSDYNYVASRDANTIDEAIFKIIDNANNWGGINVASTFVIVAPHRLRKRIERALSPDTYGFKGTDFDIQVVLTSHLTDATKYFVAPYQVAGRVGIRKDLEVEFGTDVLAYADYATGRCRIGGAIVNDKLITRCSTS